MDNLKTAFEDVADWCEKHLENKRGREIGMIFGTILRVYGRLATLPARLDGEERAVKERELNSKAEELLLELSTRFLLADGSLEIRSKVAEPISMRTTWANDPGPRIVVPSSMRTNMIYDAGLRPVEPSSMRTTMPFYPVPRPVVPMPMPTTMPYDTSPRPMELFSMRSNMIYDPAPHPQEGETVKTPTAGRSTSESAMNGPCFEIVQEEMGGWVRVFLARGEPTAVVAKCLSHSLTDWMRNRPHLRVRFVVPISRDGNTVALHAWYD